MKKTTIALLLTAMALIIALSALPLTASAASVSTESALRSSLNKGGSHKLTKDIKLNSQLVIPEGKSVTLDLNGKILDRAMTSLADNGRVIVVEKGATLIITDSSKKHDGGITGGIAPFGGAILNYGNLTIEFGTISGNIADRDYGSSVVTVVVPPTDNNGGAIYNASGATLTINGGQIINNMAAEKGGAIYNEAGASLKILERSYEDTVDGAQKTVRSNVTISGNRARVGSGIWSGSDVILSGAPTISGNQYDQDIALAEEKKIVCGKLDYTTPIGVIIDTYYASFNMVFTTSFPGNNEGRDPGELFFSPAPGVTMHIHSLQNGELRLMKNTGKTIVEAFDHGRLVFRGEYDKPGDAWTASQNYWVQCYYYFEDELMRKGVDEDIAIYTEYNTSKEFYSWYSLSLSHAKRVDRLPVDMLKEEYGEEYDAYAKASNRFWEGHLQDDYQVKITLGSDWKISDRLLIWRFRNVIVDLNGHYIDRGGKKAKNGMVFYLEEFSKLTILDSNPVSDGYGDFEGGVIANGNGDDKGGGFVLDDYAELKLLGGTIYNCKTDYHGGGVSMGDEHAKLTLKNCTFDHCQTKDSGDDCNGGAVWIKHALSVTMENVTFNQCSSEDNGGAIHITNLPGVVRLKNCTFSNNYANDYGGAIKIYSINDNKLFLFEAAGCTFINNHCVEDGGAVCVSDNDDSVYHYPIVFRDCTFTGNLSDGDGSAFELDDNSVALINCNITKNTAKGRGAVFVNNPYSVSVGGTTVIKDNTRLNLLLDKEGDKTRVYPAGLISGAEIYISSTSGDSSTLVMKDVDQRQQKYFKTESGSWLQFSKTGEKTASLTVASLFGSGSVWVVAGVAVAAVIAAVLIVVIKKNRKREAYDRK